MLNIKQTQWLLTPILLGLSALAFAQTPDTNPSVLVDHYVIHPKQSYTVNYSFPSESVAIYCQQDTYSSLPWWLGSATYSHLALVESTSNGVTQQYQNDLTNHDTVLTLFPSTLVSEEPGLVWGTSKVLHINNRNLSWETVRHENYYPQAGDASGQLTFTNLDTKDDLTLSCKYMPLEKIRNDVLRGWAQEHAVSRPE